MTRAWNRERGIRSQDYTPLPLSEKDLPSPIKSHESRWSRRSLLGLATCVGGTLLALYVLLGYAQARVAVLPNSKLILRSSPTSQTNGTCDTVEQGYVCKPKTMHHLGQYSPWFAAPSEINVAPPSGCEVSFANVLSRHGGRFPTMNKSPQYALLIAKIHNTSKAYPGNFGFLKDYQYTLGSDSLTAAGQQEMVNSGMQFFNRYTALAQNNTPFVRSASQQRVIESAQKWLSGLAQSLNTQPQPINLIIPESSSENNTLSHDSCPAADKSSANEAGDKVIKQWVEKFVPSIKDRVNSKLGTDLSKSEIISLMDLCPYDTIAQPLAQVSPFCQLFSHKEWQSYDYYQSLGKWYGFGMGNPLGPTQGVGYVNELLARLTGQPVVDHTNTNTTLDSDPNTFPLDKKLYADFSHDNDISNILAALGLYNKTSPLSGTNYTSAKNANGFSAAWTVPFAARMYVEKLQCQQASEEFVRIIVNDRVQPLDFCGGDQYGRCTLSDFVNSQSFAQQGGLWSQCYQ